LRKSNVDDTQSHLDGDSQAGLGLGLAGETTTEKVIPVSFNYYLEEPADPNITDPLEIEYRKNFKSQGYLR
jgi:hypothetical protein